MKGILLAALGLFLAAYAVGFATLESEGKSGETVLHWATDSIPARDRQTAGFSEQHPVVRVATESGDATKLIVQCATRVGPPGGRPHRPRQPNPQLLELPGAIFLSAVL